MAVGRRRCKFWISHESDPEEAGTRSGPAQAGQVAGNARVSSPNAPAFAGARRSQRTIRAASRATAAMAASARASLPRGRSR
jgi:hypothetical protein